METLRIKSDEICPRKETGSSFDVLSCDTRDTRDTEQSTSYWMRNATFCAKKVGRNQCGIFCCLAIATKLNSDVCSANIELSLSIDSETKSPSRRPLYLTFPFLAAL